MRRLKVANYLSHRKGDFSPLFLFISLFKREDTGMIEKYLMIQDSISEYVGKIIAWLPIILVGTLLYEVILRYFFNTPTIWSHELSTMLFGAFAILSGSYTLKYKAHVRSEVLYMLFPVKIQRFFDVLVQLFGLIILVIFLKLAIGFAVESWQMKEVSSRSIWQPPLYYIKSTIPLAVFLLILQSIAELVRAILHCCNYSFTDPRQSQA